MSAQRKQRTAYSKIFENRSAWSFYLTYYRQEPGVLILSVFITLVQAALFIPLAMLMRKILNEYIPNSDQSGMISAGLIVLGLLLGTSILRLANKYIILKHNKKVHNMLRDDLFKRLYNVPKAFYTKLENMRWHTIFIHDIAVLDGMSMRMLTTFLPAVVICTALGFVMLYINWLLFLIVLVIAPFVVLTVLLTKKRIKQAVHLRRQALRKYSTQINFALNMMDLTRIQVAEDVEISRQEQHNAYIRGLDFRVGWLNELFQTIQDTLLMMMTLVLLIGGGIAAINNSITLGDLFTFYVVFMFNRKYLMQLFNFIPPLINGSEALDRMHEVVGVKDSRPYWGEKLPTGNADIVVKDVSFAYIEDDPLLKDVSLTIKDGEFIALQGDNGSGKTTLLYIILGFYRPLEGEVYYGGVPHDELDIKAMRREFGVVLQESPIFRGSIRENIIYGREDIMSEEAFEQAIELSGVKRFTDTLAEGLETQVGDNGLMLSGGQRQRIAIARAMLTKPKVLVLDEPTNHLDKTAVESLLSHLESLDYKPTIIMITHIDDFVSRTDRVIKVTHDGIKIFSPEAVVSR